MDIFLVGLSLIIIGWLVQLYKLFKGDKGIQPVFLVLYVVGVGLLVYSDAVSGITTNVIFQLGTLVGGLLVLIKLLMDK